MPTLTESPVDVQTCPIPADEITRAICATLSDAPEDEAAQAALCDRYQEMGHDREAADAWVCRVVRMRRVRRAIDGSGAKSARLRTIVREYCGVGTANKVPITVVGGAQSDQRPVMTGEAPYHTFRRGGVCHYPGAARRKGYKTDYHADTREITVGVAWLESLICEGMVSRAR